MDSMVTQAIVGLGVTASNVAIVLVFLYYGSRISAEVISLLREARDKVRNGTVTEDTKDH